MSAARPQVLDHIARLHAHVRLLDLDVMAGIEVRLLLTRLTTLVGHGPVLALPWHEQRTADKKMKAANDDTFQP